MSAPVFGFAGSALFELGRCSTLHEIAALIVIPCIAASVRIAIVG